MSRSNLLNVGVALALGLSSPAHASVHIAENGRGQALLYPIFATDDGWSTLLSFTNTSDQPKAVKVIVREARVGQELLYFHVYLDAKDTWTASIFDAEGDNAGPASLTTFDTTCTVPQIYDSPAQPVAPAGNHYVEFRTFELDDGRDLADDFVDFANETRSGYVEVIEMANLVGDVVELIEQNDCDSVVDSWVGGAWSINPLEQTAMPDGGLLGQMTLLNATSAQAMSAAAVAIDGLFVQSQHASPIISEPSLATGSFFDGAQTISTVMYENEAVSTSWEHPIDAINAVLAKASLQNGFATDETLGTEWVVTFPTRPSTLVPTQSRGVEDISPFVEVYGEVDIGKACEMVIQCGAPFPPDGLYDDMGDLINPPSDICFPVPGPLSRNLCTAVTRLRIGETTVLSGGFVEQLSTPHGSSGSLDLSMLSRQARTTVTANPNSEGHVYHGLPAIGFQFSALRTDQIISSTLTNFASMQPHSGTRQVCTEACE